MRCLPLLLIPLFATAQDKKPEAKKPEKIAISDPAKLNDNKDFAAQGEYADEAFGVQVIARGEGKFDLRMLKGGLPKADSTTTDTMSSLGSGTTVDGVVSGFIKQPTPPGSRITEPTAAGQSFKIQNGSLTLGEVIMKRVERKSPTLLAKPPAGAVVLFDTPESIKNWEKAAVVELSDGKFLSVGGRTKQKFQSFNLHLEFRLPWMPASTGQGRGNSGVYLQDRYELQVLDSFGLKGVDNECGGFYKESAPKMNMCFPPMVWQTYDIDFSAAKFEDGKKTKPAVVTVKHNGVVIHDKLELKSNTPGGGITKEIPEGGALYLQNHGDPVVFRNVWIVEK